MSEERDPIEPPVTPPTATPRVRTLLTCDLVDSTALVERIGDGPAAELIRRHDRLARDLLHARGGREIDKSDGFLALFERPIEAVSFGLAYQRALRTLSDDTQHSIRARVGIHVGEVVVWENSASDIADGAKTLDVEGLAKPVVARLMSLAMPGQILLSGIAFSLAQRAERELERAASMRWLTHGRYRFKGVAAPMLVHEVGEGGVAPLQAPPSGPKAQRDVPIWRQPGIIALEAIALLAAVAIPIALSLRAPPAIAFGERDWIVMAELNNLTGETLLDDSLETAFRISLEQSRFVNVLPDLKLRDALARMQRPPDTVIDRNVASEIALREGARAVILPTVAEIGGRVRVSAEVIDPHTQTTVYAESADGVGAPSALDSIDTVTHTLRAKLGEALSSIEEDSAPLPQVTSANLNALRAYALGYQAYLRTDYREALALYEQALNLDPDFSQAKVGIARIHLNGENYSEARRNVTEALSHRERLPARELLYTEAFDALLEYRKDYLDRWKNLIAIYPDFFPSYYNYALYAHERENEFGEAIAVAEEGLDQKNPAYGHLHYFVAAMELGSEHYEKALDRLERAKVLDSEASRWLWARLYGAQRDYASAERAVANFKLTGIPANDVLGHVVASAILSDRGDLNAALAHLGQGSAKADAAGPFYVRVFEGAALTLRELTESPDALRLDLDRFVESEVRASRDYDLSQRPYSALALAWASAAASRARAPDLAAVALSKAEEAMSGLHYPVVSQMIAAAKAQVALQRGDVHAAQSALGSIEADRMLVTVRATEIEVLAKAGELKQARERAAALAVARGRSYVEFGSSNHMLQLRNVIETNLALLRGAELALEDGDKEAALRDLQRFEQVWPAQQLPRAIHERVHALRAALASL